MEVNDIILSIQQNDSILLDNSFQYAKACSMLLRNEEKANDGRRIIVHILDSWEKIPTETQEMWTDLIESAGFYPYLEKEKTKLQFNSLAGQIRKEFHNSENIKKYFHEEQKLLREILGKNKNLIVSAPTSFGKSLLIEEIVAGKKHKNIVVIQPSLALLDETRRKLKKYKDNYKIIVRTSQEPSNEKGNLFLLTSERVLEYKRFPNIDFLVIDEFYKLSTKRDDERADHLNNAFYYLLKNFNPKFYLLGPNIDGISEGFTEKYNAEFYKTRYSLIDNTIIDIYAKHKDKFSKPRKNKEYKENILFELLFSLKDEQNIIYCSSPKRVRDLASKFCKYLEGKRYFTDENIPLIEWIKIHISDKWNLIDFLKYQIGINDGGIQKHINSSMINYFNDGKLKYMFCTSTIIEGVNTSAKNVIIFDSTKGRNIKIDFFDHSNIKGRSGRMMIHYVGNIYDFNISPKKENVIVDIPFFEQDPDPKKFPPEIEIRLDDTDIIDKTREQYQEINRIPEEEKEIIKNNGVLVKGQQAILKQLEEDINQVQNLIIWNRTPKYDQLKYSLDLCWDNLLKKGETTFPMTKNKITKVTFDYGINQDIGYLIKSTYTYYKKTNKFPDYDDAKIYNEAIREAFHILRHWFQYKVPKWLSVMNELQKYVCEKNNLRPGNYTWYANQIENDFIQENLTILSEYGIPKSAIEKIKSTVHSGLNEDEVVKKAIEYTKLQNNNLLKYELERINDVL